MCRIWFTASAIPLQASFLSRRIAQMSRNFIWKCHVWFLCKWLDQIPDDQMTNNVVDDLRKITFQSSSHWSVHPIFDYFLRVLQKKNIQFGWSGEMKRRKSCAVCLFDDDYDVDGYCSHYFGPFTNDVWTLNSHLNCELNHLSIFGALQTSILNCESWNASPFRPSVCLQWRNSFAIFGSRKLLKTFLINYSWSFQMRRVFTIWNKAEIGCVSIGLFPHHSNIFLCIVML